MSKIWLALMAAVALILSGCAQQGGLVRPSTEAEKTDFDRRNPDLAPRRAAPR